MNKKELLSIVRRHRPRIEALLQRYPVLAGRIQCDDIEQEIVVRVLQRGKRSDTSIEQLSSYIRSVAFSVVIDSVRQAPPVAAPLEGEELADDEPADQSYRNEELVGLVERARAKLSENRALAVGLRLQGFSNPEIARLTGWTDEQTRNLASRGLRQLRDELRLLGVDEHGIQVD